MIIFLILMILIVQIINFYVVESIICRPPNVFAHVFAPPGTGKTTLVAKIVREAFESGKKVYSNVPIIGAYKFDIKDLGKKEFRNCVILIDEAGSNLSNRNWQNNLNEDQIRFLKLHRHYNVDIWTFSQAYGEVDVKFRDLTTLLLMLKKSRLPFFVFAMAIKKTMDLINGQIVEFFEYDRSSSFRFFTPRLWAWFNSYQTDMDLEKPLIEMRYTKSETT